MLISISNNNPDPLYKQVKDQIIEAILTGELKKDDNLPSIRKMAKELKISVITIKRAYAEMESEGYIYTRAGLGSFVTGINRDNLRREKMKEIKNKFKEIIDDGKSLDIDIKDLINILREMEGDY